LTGPTREAVRGTAVGIAVLACFALAWTGWGMSTGVPTSVATPLHAVTISCSVILVAGALLTYRWAGRIPAGASQATDRGRRIGHRFGLIVAAEFIGLATATWIVAVTGHPRLIPAIVCLGVGIHFFPLRRLFAVPIYDRTGAGLCLIAMATFVLAPATGRPALWTIVPGVGAALILYATCVLLLRDNIISTRHGRERSTPALVDSTTTATHLTP
jgi:hypothetical protein